MDNFLSKKNDMYYNGSLFNKKIRSYYGYRLDELKSGVQKYLRRRELNKMIWCVVELYLFKFCGEKGYIVLSNLINRIKIYLDEEMVFEEWNRYLEVMNLLDLFKKKYKDKEYKNEGLKVLIKICRILVDSNMIRINSDIKKYFGKGIDKYNLKLKNVEISDEVKLIVSKFIKEGDSDKNIELFSKFVELFEKKDDECFYYVMKLLYNELDGEKGGKRFRRKGCSLIIWEYLIEEGKKKNNEDLNRLILYKLNEYYKLRGEKCIFMFSVIYLLKYYEDIDWDKKIDFGKYDVDDEYINNMFNNRIKIELDSYVIDMHCSRGRKNGKNKIDFVLEGSLIVNEYKKYFKKEWRDMYINFELENKEKRKRKKRKKKVKKEVKIEKKVKKEEVKKVKKEIKKEVKIEKKVKKEKKEKEVKIEKVKKEKKKNNSDERKEKMKKIKKLRGKINFNDLENGLEFRGNENFDVKKIKLCSKNVCGNKVMCFEYNGKIYKEGRKSMSYNRDYICFDECKELFGLKKIGMKRFLSDFRIERINKKDKYWDNNWKMVKIGDNEEKVVYCEMNKIGNGVMGGEIKKEIINNRELFKEFVKIGVVRGIFRVSDFNLRNVLVNENNELVSIDEGDIGKRVGIIGRRKWIIKNMNKDKRIINEILKEIKGKGVEVLEIMRKYKFNEDMCSEVINNWGLLELDLIKEGVEGIEIN